MKKNCFTLIELLIVIAILGILVSILLPTLSKAREKAFTAVCLSNNKQLSNAMAVFLKNSKNKLPVTTNDAISYDDRLAKYEGRNLTQDEINQHPLPKSYEKEAKLYRCPSSKQDSDDYALRSYAVNGGSSPWGESGKGVMWNNGSRYISEIYTPSENFLFIERDQPGAWNRLGWFGNSVSRIQQHVNLNPWIDQNMHGTKRKTYTMIDSSSKIMSWKETSNSKYWHYDE